MFPVLASKKSSARVYCLFTYEHRLVQRSVVNFSICAMIFLVRIPAGFASILKVDKFIVIKARNIPHADMFINQTNWFGKSNRFCLS